MNRIQFSVKWPGHTPEVVVWSALAIAHGVDFEGGGLPLGSGDLIRDAKSVLEREGVDK